MFQESAHKDTESKVNFKKMNKAVFAVCGGGEKLK
jgi:hypothetical protein